MSFGVEEKQVPLPYVETQNIKFGVVTEFPKFKYHPQYPQGLKINDAEEELALGDEWVDSPAEFGVETHPQISEKDAVLSRLAQIREAVNATKSKSK